MSDRIKKVSRDAYETFREQKQYTKAIEELNELSVEIAHFLEGRGNTEKLSDEMADVLFVVTQLKTHMDDKTNGEFTEMLKRDLEYKVSRMEQKIRIEKGITNDEQN